MSRATHPDKLSDCPAGAEHCVETEMTEMAEKKGVSQIAVQPEYHESSCGTRYCRTDCYSSNEASQALLPPQEHKL